jgi:3-deoxy-D-manno-octulosonic-acid transferase
VAGSTHHPEERGLITAVRRLRERHPAIVLVIAPRQIDRARAIVRDVERGGLRASLWSEAQAGAPPAWDVLVVDRFGVVAALYAFADIVVMGGTFVSVGGHNLLEPAVQGRPILVGPHCDHVRATACALEAAGALQQVADADDLVDAVDRLIADRVRRMEMGTCARGYVRSHQGAARRCAAAIAEALAGET